MFDFDDLEGTSAVQDAAVGRACRAQLGDAADELLGRLLRLQDASQYAVYVDKTSAELKMHAHPSELETSQRDLEPPAEDLCREEDPSISSPNVESVALNQVLPAEEVHQGYAQRDLRENVANGKLYAEVPSSEAEKAEQVAEKATQEADSEAAKSTQEAYGESRESKQEADSEAAEAAQEAASQAPEAVQEADSEAERVAQEADCKASKAADLEAAKAAQEAASKAALQELVLGTPEARSLGKKQRWDSTEEDSGDEALGMLSSLGRSMSTWASVAYIGLSFTMSSDPMVAGRQIANLCRSKGGIYVKAAQTASSMEYAFPKEVLEEFQSLQDSADPQTWQEIATRVSKHTPGGIERMYDSFEKQPINAASIAQVHVATRKTGEKVAVKLLGELIMSWSCLQVL